MFPFHEAETLESRPRSSLSVVGLVMVAVQVRDLSRAQLFSMSPGALATSH